MANVRYWGWIGLNANIAVGPFLTPLRTWMTAREFPHPQIRAFLIDKCLKPKQPLLHSAAPSGQEYSHGKDRYVVHH